MFRSTRLRWLPLLLLLAGWLSNCAGAPASNQALEYRRTGGIVGLDDRLVIDTSGNVTVTRKARTRTFTLSTAQLAELDQLFADAGFMAMQAQYLPANAGADLLEYTITYKNYTVRAKDTAVPTQLLPVIAKLNQLIERGP